MLYSLLYRFGKPFYCTRILSRVNGTCPPSALYLPNSDLIKLNKSPGAQWVCVHYYNALTQVRKVHTGAESRNKAHGEREKSVSSTQTPSGISATQKGICIQTTQHVCNHAEQALFMKSACVCSSEASWERFHVSDRGDRWTWSYR